MAKAKKTVVQSEVQVQPVAAAELAQQALLAALGQPAPAAPAAPAMAISPEQLQALLKMVGKQAPAPAAPAVRLEGPEPDSLKGVSVVQMAQALAQAEHNAAADKDGIGKAYEKRASQIRMLIWKREYA